eukprot:TRINITY_DN16694_c0_g1_i1.p1 TRINITY_DN16694_c0_g1~~TRINITY_DN16694_c0_g1_i1.p1  ORF type:complete len:220 (+),score=15.20 TRINITY_DN16694_c0_g1_i1:75-734(+)
MTMNVYLVLFALFFSLSLGKVKQQCSTPGFYGQDCSCTSPFTSIFPTLNATCSQGTWTYIPPSIGLALSGEPSFGLDTIVFSGDLRTFGYNVTLDVESCSRHGRIRFSGSTSQQINFAQSSIILNYIQPQEMACTIPIIEGLGGRTFSNTGSVTDYRIFGCWTVSQTVDVFSNTVVSVRVNITSGCEAPSSANALLTRGYSFWMTILVSCLLGLFALLM